MKKLMLIGLIHLLCVTSYSQFITKSISFELRYPFPVGDNFINKGLDNGYLGLIDLGVDYNLFKNNGLGLGVTLNSSLLRLNVTDVTLLIISPKIKVEYEIDLNKILIIPQIGIGYSNWRFRAPDVTLIDEFGNPVGMGKSRDDQNGLTLEAATKLVINNDRKLKWYFNLSYEFTKLEKPEYDSGDTKFNRNIQLLYPGIGVIWNFGE